jgi:hypothetical protein
MIDRFLSSQSFCTVPELNEDARVALLENAEMFFRAGGVLSLSDWEGLSDDSRAAFMGAKERFDANNTTLLALALGAPNQSVSSVYSLIDGGEWQADLLLSDATDLLIQKVGVS